MSTGLTPVTRKEMYLSAAAGETETSALPTPVTREEIYLNEIAQGGGGGGTVDAYTKAETDALLSGKQNTLSTAQLSAANSGIDSTKVAQIATNQGNIEGQQNTTATGGNGYAIINGIRLYVATSAPTGDIPDGSYGLF